MLEQIETYSLAALGAVQGVARYYGPRSYAGRAWAAVGAGVLAYELSCPAGETLSEGVDRALKHHRLITTAAIGVTALHLANLLPERIDPIHWAFKVVKEDL